MVKVACKICGKQCKGEVLKLSDSFFHIGCFKCSECAKSLANESFFTHEGKYYCEADYGRKFGASCAACGRIVDDSSRAVAALGKTFHESCFRCSRCGNYFKPGHKVSLAGKEHLCTNCVTGFVRNPNPPTKQGRPAARPVTTSTPLEKQKTLGTSSVPPKSNDKSMGYVSGPEGIDSIGPSDVEEQDLIDSNQQPLRCASPLSGDDTFSDLSASRQFSPRPTNGVGDSDPTHQTLYGSARHSSRNKTVQFEPKFRSTFGQHLSGSYLQHGMSYLRRAGSTPPAGAPPQAVPNSQSPHFNRPDNFSYRHPAKRFVRSKKGGLVQLMEYNARAATDKVAGQIKEEAIKMSHYASARAPTPKDVPAIERDDFPAPPASVNVIGYKLRRRDDESGDEEHIPDPKLARDIDQLEMLAKDHSGVAEVILRELQNCAAHAGELDPRSASRTPAANHEPAIPTRYMSSMFASPSRFSDHPRSGRFFSTPPPGVEVDAHGATMPAGINLSTSTKTAHRDPKSSTLPVGNCGDRSQYKSDTSLDADNVLYYKTHYRAATMSDVCPAYLSEAAGLKHSLGQVPTAQTPQVFSYETLKGGTNKRDLPKNADREHLESHLSSEEFQTVFGMPRDSFYRQPEWKQNDMKQRVELY